MFFIVALSERHIDPQVSVQTPPHTFKQRTDLPPAGDAPLTGELSQRRLQEEDRDATGEQEDQVRDEERT